MGHRTFSMVVLAAGVLASCGDADDGGDGFSAPGHSDAAVRRDAMVDAASGELILRPIVVPSVGDGGDDAGSDPCGNGVLDDGEMCDPGARKCCNATCDGVLAAGTTCRAATGPCDVTDECDGKSDACSDDVAAAGVACRIAAGPCDLDDACDGVGKACPDLLRPNGDLCRASTGECDVDDFCTGTDPTCPDGFEPDNTACDLPTTAPQGNAVCSSGMCCPGFTRNRDGTGCGFPGEDNVVFVTSISVLNGGFGGVATGDELCATLAAEANLRGTWHAWLSATSDAVGRVSDGPYRRVDGQTVAANPADLTDGSLNVAIAITETNLNPGPVQVYTGSELTGLQSGSDCLDWTDSSGASAQVGGSHQVDGSWTQSGTLTCYNPAHLYCFQDDCPGIRNVDFMTDAKNCGGCGIVCSGSCVAGKC